MINEVDIIPVLHNVMSVQKIQEIAKLVYGLGFKTLVISRALGSAAQVGVPEAQKIAIKLGRNLLYLGDIDDVIDIFKPDFSLFIMPKKYGSKPLSNIITELRGKVLVIIGGTEPGLSSRELSKGLAVFPEGIDEDIGTVGLMAITLYILRKYTTLKVDVPY